MATIQNKPTSDLILYNFNNKIHSEEQIDKIANSIKEFWFNQPIVVDTNNIVVVWHGRLAAAKKLWLEEVPVLTLDLDDKKIKKYRILDNKLSDIAEWDIDNIKLELEDINDDELNELFPEIELDDDEEYDEETQDDIPDVPDNIIVEEWDIFQLWDHRLMCGDSTNIETVETLMDGQKADMVFTDPPYWIDVVQGNKIWWDKAFWKILWWKTIASKTYSKIIWDETTDTARDVYNLCVTLWINHIALWGWNYFTDFIPPSRVWWIWNKQTTWNFSQCEMCWTNFEKGWVTIYDFLWNWLAREWDKKTEWKMRVHPTQKPVWMIIDIFNDIEDKKILDLFGWSWSTLIACEKTKRKCYMMELDPKYIQVIIKRYHQFTNWNKEIKCLNRDLDVNQIIDA